MRPEDDLLDFIKGVGKYGNLAPGIFSYPKSKDTNQVNIHAGCLLLESEGKIIRVRESDGQIFWEPIDENSTNL